MLRPVERLLAYDVSAFIREGKGGNMAGVVLLPEGSGFPSDVAMARVAAVTGYSEVVFARRVSSCRVVARYFTPEQEVGMCGHATLALFNAYMASGLAVAGECELSTPQGEYRVCMAGEGVGLRAGILFPDVRVEGELSVADAREWYAALSLTYDPSGSELLPVAKVHAGLSDILCPVADRRQLDAIRADRGKLVSLSQRHGVVGLHAFTRGDAANHYFCRNFAPAVGIDEESATGTSNVGLACWLRERERELCVRQAVLFHQGDAMGVPSTVEVSFMPSDTPRQGCPILSGECLVYDRTPMWLSSLEADL